MPVLNRIAAFQEEMAAWRHAIHAHPETAFEEHRTSAFVAQTLRSFGLAAEQGLARTGVIARLDGKAPGPAIGLRADMDALHIHEMTDVAHASQVAGKMHACGHDGHTAMLLGAARYLAETRNFAGTVYFIFQPAEENEGGGRVMVEEGLFDRCPMEAVYGLHNWPGQPAGTIAVWPGPMMAAYDVFEITVTGRGSHAAMPHQGIDPVLASAALVTALQSIASRTTDPLQSAVVSVTQIHGGDTWNVIPDSVVLRGTARSFRPDVQDAIEAGIRRIAAGVAAAHGAAAEVRYERRYPATVNSAAEAEVAARAAGQVVGDGNVLRAPSPSMGSEDFAFMLQARPGSYVWLGIGEDRPRLHNPRYDFADEALAVGASYWARLVETALPPAG
ncbi:MAG: M20 aminoacylase family protein [Dongiaceae bacterium]